MMKKVLSLLLVTVLCMAYASALADSYSDMLEKAATYVATEDYTKAIASYQLAQKLRPQDEIAFLGEANVHILLENYIAASTAISAAIDINPVSPEAWTEKCRVDALFADISTFEQDVVFAEVCEADLSEVYLPAASMYAAAGIYEKAVPLFEMCNLNDLNDDQKEQYRRALVLSGDREKAENLGLATVTARNKELDAAFDADHLMLVKAELPTVAAENFEFPEELWAAIGVEIPENPIAEVASAISGAELTWLSLSPEGNSGILVANDTTSIGYYKGKYHLLYPSSSRGVEDVNENLAKVAAIRPQNLLGEAGVIYSPDGHYAAMFNIEYTLMRAQYILDPIIIDLSTGEMILTSTYGNKPTKDAAGAVTTATFSADGKYLYFMMWENMAEFRTALYRYDIQSQQTELCYSGSDTNYYPNLFETGNGAFTILRDARKKEEFTGITYITFNKGTWTGKEYSFDLPMKYWCGNRILSSANSGYAFIPGRLYSLSSSYYAFQVIMPDEEFGGLNQYYAISKDGDLILPYNAGEITTLFESWTNGSQEEGVSTFTLDMPFQIILASVLSPDGRYALLNTSNPGSRDNPISTRHLYLLRLSDFSLREVSGINPEDILVGTLGASYRPVIEWNTDTLIIGTSDGIQPYKFQLE